MQVSIIAELCREIRSFSSSACDGRNKKTVIFPAALAVQSFGEDLAGLLIRNAWGFLSHSFHHPRKREFDLVQCGYKALFFAHGSRT